MTELEKAARQALEALEETRNALAWFYDSYPEDVTLKGNELLPRVEVVLADMRRALEQPAQQEPVAWRELCRRLYVELFHCDQQMMATLDEDGEPMWQQGATVRDALADAKAALEGSRPQAREWVGLTDEEIWFLWENCEGTTLAMSREVEAKLREKNA